jgi:hypothetical protein
MPFQLGLTFAGKARSLPQVGSTCKAYQGQQTLALPQVTKGKKVSKNFQQICFADLIKGKARPSSLASELLRHTDYDDSVLGHVRNVQFY